MREPVHAELLEVGQRAPHPFVLVYYGGAAVQGLVLFIGPLFGWEPSPALATIPDLVEVPLGMLILVGALLLNVGAWWPLSDRFVLSKAWALEQFGVMVSMGGFLALAIAAMYASPAAFLAWFSPLLLAAALFSRFWVLGRREAVTRLVVSQNPEVQP